jgi:hypothetical protein
MKNKVLAIFAAGFLTACAEGEIPSTFTVDIEDDFLSFLNDNVQVSEGQAAQAQPEVLAFYTRSQSFPVVSGSPIAVVTHTARLAVTGLDEYELLVDGDVSLPPFQWQTVGELDYAPLNLPIVQLCKAENCYDVDQWIEE